MDDQKDLPKPEQELPKPEKELTSGASAFGKNDLITVILLVFLFPIGVILMWFMTRWPKWVKILLTLPFILGIVGLFLGIFVLGKIASNDLTDKKLPPNQDEQVFCTQEAMLCPDGVTYVSREGPNCEFAQCPEGNKISYSDYSDLLTNITTFTTSGDYASLTELQQQFDSECHDQINGLPQPLCEGLSEGEVISGYALGRNQSEGALYSKEDFILQIKDYFNRYSPFEILGEKRIENKAIIVFKGKPTQQPVFDTMITFKVVNNNNEWVITNTIIGPLTEEYRNMDNILFNF